MDEHVFRLATGRISSLESAAVLDEAVAPATGLIVGYFFVDKTSMSLASHCSLLIIILTQG